MPRNTTGITRSGASLAFLFVLALSTAQPSHSQGFVYTFPPNVETISSTHRNHVFMVGDTVAFSLSNPSAVSYTVRDYYGNICDSGNISGQNLTVNVSAPGWYKLYINGATNNGSPYGTVIGGTNFVIFRQNSNFPANPPPGTSGSMVSSDDEIARGVTGMGPQRHFVTDCNNPSADYAQLDYGIGLDNQYYTPYDSYRKRPLMIVFPNGTTNLAGVKQVVQRYQDRVTYWEGRNEPNYIMSGAAFAAEEQAFYQTVKSVNPNLKVLGPACVSIDPGLQGWITDFLNAGGGKYIDGFSFHAYNVTLGDTILSRQALTSLNTLLAKYGLQNIEKWQTEQGYFAACYGAYQPNLQGRWTMVQMMVYEQFGIPKEHNHLWYDCSDGFWSVPTFWENDDGSLNPAAPLMRVWSEELYGKTFTQAYDFGSDPGDNLYIGSLFTGPSGSVAAFTSSGSTDGQITLNVTGGDHIHTVSAFGVATDLPLVNGTVTLPTPMLPVYVELLPGQTITPQAVNWGANLALQSGVTSIVSGTSAVASENADIYKLTDGVLWNHYWDIGYTDAWWDSDGTFPVGVEVHLPTTQTIDHVVVYAMPPFSWQSTLLNYDLQYWSNGQWVTINTINEPTNTYNLYSPQARCTVDSFFSDRWAFIHSFAPVSTSAIRLLIHSTTYGGGATQAVVNAGGQTGPEDAVIRQIGIYNDGQTGTPTPAPPAPTPPVTYQISGQVTNSAQTALSGVTVTLGSGTTTTTNGSGQYAFTGLAAGTTYTVTPSFGTATFAPSSATIANLGANQTANFASQALQAPTLNATAGAGQVNLAWTSISGACAYTLSRSTTSGQETVLQQKLTGTSYTDTSVTAGQTYYYTLACTNSAETSPASAEVHAAPNPPAATYTINGQINNASSAAIAGVTVTLSNGATTTTSSTGSYSFTGLPSGVSYTITPTQTNVIFAPPSATVANLSANQTVSFTGTAAPTPIDPVSSIWMNGSSVGEGGTITCWLTLANPAPAGTVVSITSSVAGAVVIPASVSVPTGQSTVSFPIQGGAVATNTPVKVSMTSGGTPAVACLTVNAPNITSVSTNVGQVVSGQTFVFTVQISAPAPSGGFPVSLSSSMPGIIAPPSILAIPAGATSQTVTLTGTDTSGSGDEVTLAGSANGSSMSTIIAVQPGSAPAPPKPTPPMTYQISGQVTNSAQTALSGVTVTLGSGTTTTTNGSGQYAFTGLAAGTTYTVTPSFGTAIFAPSSATIANLGANQTANFASQALQAPTLNATAGAGQVNLGWTSISGACAYTLSRSTTSGQETVLQQKLTGTSYTDTSVTAGQTYYYTLACTNSAETSPASAEVHAAPNPPAATYTINGQINNASSAAIAGVTVTLSNGATTTTSSTGSYSFTGLPSGVSYTITPTQTNVIFAPPSATVANLSANQTVSFTGTAAPTPIDPVSSIWMNGSSVGEGGTITCWLTLANPAPAGTVVSITSSVAGAVVIPASVSVPTGQSTVSFPIQGGAVATNTPVKVSMTSGGTPAVACLTVNAPNITSVSTNVGQVVSGQTFVFTVQISAPAPSGGFPVSLSSSMPGIIAPPSILAIPAGATSQTVTLTGTDTSGSGDEVTLAGSANGSSMSTIIAVQP